MNTVDLNFSDQPPVRMSATHGEGLDKDILIQNARWFTRIRWVVVAVLTAFGVLTRLFPAVPRWLFGMSPAWWPLVLAGVLTAMNLLLAFLLRPAREPFSRRFVVACIWGQILVDLVVLTHLVNRVGGTDTYIAFAYLFHIVLACIFFPPRHSFLVTVLAALLFLGSWLLETAGWLPHVGLLSLTELPRDPVLAAINALSAVFIWFVVWYLTSTISEAVRERDSRLAKANDLLVAANREKNLLMLRTTHDLKAPFSSIETSIEMLKLHEWEALPASARAVINSIEVRAATLRERIKDILLLGELRATGQQASRDEAVDLDALLTETVEDLSAKAGARHVTVSLSAPRVTVVSSRKQLGAVFANLIANAITYSMDGGRVEVSVEREAGGARVRISDQGIGISAKALPHIFDEYFRSPEAAKINPMSTGLGLAIVKDIAQNLLLRVRVSSEQGKGTTFEVIIPAKEETSHGSRHDHR